LFALFDVLLQKWSPAWGPGRFLPVMLGFVAVFSIVLIPMFREPLTAVPRPAWPWLLGGCVLLGSQSMLFGLTIVLYGNATAANVIYSSRGLWSVVGVWLIGHWFKNREQHLGPRVLAWRFLGAALMVCAIVLVLV
jgi:drug/metabolite transporter (DMT)-like permease